MPLRPAALAAAGRLRALAEPLAQRGVEADARLERVHEAHADRDRDRRDRRGVDERAQADPAHAPQIAEVRDRERERGDHDQRDHEHEQQAQEDLARGLDRIAHQRVDGGRSREQRVRGRAEREPAEQAREHLERQALRHPAQRRPRGRQP